MTLKNIEERIRSIEQVLHTEKQPLNTAPDVFISNASAKYGPMPGDLQADIESADEYPTGTIVSDPAFLAVANRLARWLGCGNQWNA